MGLNLDISFTIFIDPTSQTNIIYSMVPAPPSTIVYL